LITKLLVWVKTSYFITPLSRQVPDTVRELLFGKLWLQNE